MKTYQAAHLVKMGDLNHHGTLFAGRSAEWMVEASFAAAACEHGQPDEIVCVHINGITYKKPIDRGEILVIESRIAKVSATSMVVHAEARSEISGTAYLESYMTFVCIDVATRTKKPHQIVLDEPADDREKELRARAAGLRNN